MPIDSIKWGLGRKKAFVDQLDYELTDAIGVHDPLVAQWIRWLELYRAPVKQPERNIPYEGAANFMLPIIATDSDQLYAKFLQTLHAADNLWTLSPLNERWTESAKPIQDFLQWLDHSLLKMYNVNKRVLGEMVKLGTGIYKTGWTYEKRNVNTYDQFGKSVRGERVKGAPFVDHVRLADFVFPHNAYSIDPDAQGGASWVAERIRVAPERLRWMAQSSAPYLPNIDKDTLASIIRFEETGVTPFDQAIQSADYTKASQGAEVDFETEKGPASTSSTVGAPGRVIREIELWEIHARYPTGDSDSQDDVIIWYHRPTRSIVRGVYNYYHHGKRPYDAIRYFPGDGFYGIGVAEQTELFQTSASDMFNFTWDNVLLANSRMVVAKAGSNIAPGEPFYPNKVWITDDDVNKAFGIFPMADIYQSLPMLSEQIMALKNNRNGMGDLQMGQINNLPSRTPATTTMSLMQEGARRPDLTIKDMRYEGISTVGLRILQICQQYMTRPAQDVGGANLLRIAMDVLGNPEGQNAADKLSMPLENVEYGLGCTITATSASHNKEVEKQNYMGLLQLAGQLTPQFLQLAQVAVQAQGSPIGQVALESAQGLTELYKRLLEQFDIRNPEAMLPDSFTTSQTAGPTTGSSAGPLYGPTGQPPATAIDPRLAALATGLGGAV